jgi:hypothetical protein
MFVLRSLLLAFAVLSSPQFLRGEETLRFNQDIRPILSENCFHCHGPDDAAREAGLRLDTEDGAKEWAIVPGDAESSEVVTRIFSEDPDSLMPPPESELALSQQQQQLLRRWIEQGASYERHWSFEPPSQPSPPKAGLAWASNPIDRFIYRRLEEHQLLPAPEVDRETLIRRLTFDLIGLPPTLAEIDAYLNDPSPNATEKVVDRLLSDPRFGERMAADWLDVARYSDTYGYQVDRDRFVWPWKEWVINAFNRNLSYDQFVTEQLAGDLLPDATREQMLATTFNRLHPQKVEGGSVPEEFRIEYVADRTQTVGTAFLGLTFECCRCHSHKYDPISQAEYYELSSFFDNIDEAGLYSFFTQSIPTPTLKLPTDAEERRLEELSATAATRSEHYQQVLSKAIQNTDLDLSSFAVGPDSASATAAEAADGNNGSAPLFSKPIEAVDFDDKIRPPNTSVPGVRGNAVQLTGDDAVNLSVGNFRRDQPFSVSLWLKTPEHKQRAVVFHRSRAWTDAASRGYQLLIEDGRLSWSLIHFWPGNAIRIRTQKEIPIDRWIHVTVTNDGSGRAKGLQIWMDGERADVETIRDGLSKNITGGGGDNIAIGQRFRDRGFTSGCVDQMRVFDAELTALEIERLSTPKESLPWLAEPAETWSPTQRESVARHLAIRHDPNVNQARSQLAAARRQLCSVQDRVKEIMVMRETETPRQTYRLDRGAYTNRAEEVESRTPRVLPEFKAQYRRDRLGLARWMTDPNHPLTSRVAVNRLWQLCFGIGLVRTPEDFGSQGEPPTHPELLDWLAVDFVNHGWDIKRTLKQIVLSSTYQMSTQHPDRETRQKDPSNRWLSRHPAYRLPAEMLRDQALAFSGHLVSEIGGPPVKPYEVEASFKPTKRDQGPGLYRRSLYTYWKRTGPAPAMMTLDASKRDVCRVRRERTSSPLQAFVLLNGPQYIEAARGLAFRLIKRHGDDNEAVLLDLFRTLTARHATQAEREIIEDLYEQQLKYFRERPQRRNEYLSVGEARQDPPCDSAVFAATASVASTLMNFDECVMKR